MYAIVPKTPREWGISFDVEFDIIENADGTVDFLSLDDEFQPDGNATRIKNGLRFDNHATAIEHIRAFC